MKAHSIIVEISPHMLDKFFQSWKVLLLWYLFDYSVPLWKSFWKLFFQGFFFHIIKKVFFLIFDVVKLENHPSSVIVNQVSPRFANKSAFGKAFRIQVTWNQLDNMIEARIIQNCVRFAIAFQLVFKCQSVTTKGSKCYQTGLLLNQQK